MPRFSACCRVCKVPHGLESASKRFSVEVNSKKSAELKRCALLLLSCSHTFQIRTHFAKLSTKTMEPSFTEQTQIRPDFILMASHFFVQAKTKMYKPTI